MVSPFVQRQKIVEVGRWMYERGYVAGVDGNLSLRAKDGNIMITPSGICKGRMLEDDIVLIDRDGKQISGMNGKSSEFQLHTQIYRVRSDIDAIVHAHPVYSTAFACTEKGLPSGIMPEVILSLGNIPTAPYGTPSTSELAESVARLIPDHNALLLENHGVVTVGRDLEEAFIRLELVEHYARILHAAADIGGAKELSREQISALLSLKPDIEPGVLNDSEKGQ